MPRPWLLPFTSDRRREFHVQLVIGEVVALGADHAAAARQHAVGDRPGDGAAALRHLPLTQILPGAEEDDRVSGRRQTDEGARRDDERAAADRRRG